jgi:hypothetical protein
MLTKCNLLYSLSILLGGSLFCAGENHPCEFGVEGPAPHDLPDVKLAESVVRRSSEELPVFLKATKDLGAEFFVCQFTPPQNTAAAKSRAWIGTEGTQDNVRSFAAACKKAGLTFFINQEITNYSEPGEFLDRGGVDMLAHPDGSHRWDVKGDLLDTLVTLPGFRGVLYDEPEHAQTWDKRQRRYFAVTRGMDLFEAYGAVHASAKNVADSYRKAGTSIMTEHVFPAMFHTFARAGIDACPKFLKEGRDPIWAALAIGAAKQYGTGFSVTPDLWGKSGFPGHSPEELRCAMLFAYWMGAEKIFVENIYADFIGKPTGLLDRRVRGDGQIEYVASEYGKVFQWFAREYAPKNPRPYSFREVIPEIVIVRFPDGYWGQKPSWLKGSLYGADVVAGPESTAWINIWHLLTHGHTSEQGISFHNRGWKVGHDFFCPLNNVVVYDHLVDRKTLANPKLIFLTGVSVSDATLRAIRDCVRNGATCISLKSLAPGDVSGRGDLVPDGLGRWVLTNDFKDQQSAESAAPYLGKKIEIRYRFGQYLLRVEQGKRENEIRIMIEQELPEKKMESNRVW